MERVGPFRLGRRIGSGGMGEVFEGTRGPLQVAVKLVHASLAQRSTSREAFRNEVRAVASLDHPAIVRVYDHGEHQDRPYLVMELLSGRCLDAQLGRLGWGQCRAALLTLLDALAHAHARGVVHRDIKPANVLVDEDRVVLTDFGLAQALTDAGSARVAGTPTYMSPEQFRGRWRDYGPWTDLYSLGVLGWELVCGAPPFQDLNVSNLRSAHLYSELPPFRPLCAVPEGLADWLGLLLRKDIRHRFQRAADAAWALHGLGEALERPTLVPAVDPLPRPTFGTLPAGPALTWMGGTLVPEASVDLPEAEPTEGQPPPPPSDLPRSWRRVESKTQRLLPGAGLGLVGLRQARLVGRDAARDTIWEALRAARTAPQVVVLRGPAGIGKSRLAEWMAERAHEVGAARVFRASHGAMAGPSHGLAAMLRRHLRCEGLSGPALRDRVAARGREPELVVPFLEGLGGRPRDRHALLRRALQGRRPALVWLDDAQWGPDSIGFALSMLEGDAQALVVLTVQDEALAQEEHAAELIERLTRAGATSLRLEPLVPQEQRELVHDLLGLSGGLADEVQARSDGSPLFAVELVNELVGRGALEPGEGGFHLRKGEQAELSPDLRAVWARRLAEVLGRRDLRDAAYLRLAAALGTLVVDEEWEAVCRLGGQLGVSPVVDWEDLPGLDPPLAALRETLVEARLALRRGPSSWSFAHAMLREALEPRAQDHRVCAKALQGEDERVARHLLAARDWQEALPPLDRAVSEHRTRGAFADAHRLLHRKSGALRALGVAPESPEWADLLSTRATMHRLVGDFERFEQESTEAERRARESASPLALGRILRGRGETRRQRGRMDDAEACFREALPLLAGEDSYEEAECWRGLGDTLRQRRRFDEAARAYSEGLEVQDPRARPTLLRGLASLATREGDVDRTRALLDEAQEGFARLGARIGQANCLNDLGDLERAAGNGAEAEAAYRQAMAWYRLHGAYADIWPRVNLALLWLDGGPREGLTAWLGEVLRDVQRVGIPSLEAGVLVALALAEAQEGDLDRASERLEQAALLLHSTGDADPDNAWALWRLSGLAGRRDRPGLSQRAAALAAEQETLLE